jgi:hypothetical protein
MNICPEDQSRTVSLVALHRCETWLPTQREEHRLSENRVSGRIVGYKREEVKTEHRKMNNGNIHNLFSPINSIGVIKCWRMNWVIFVVWET